MGKKLLVLAGGGPHGIMVHLAVLKKFEDNGYQFDEVRGISAGALAGYVYRKVGANNALRILKKSGKIIKQRWFWWWRFFKIDYIVDRRPIEKYLDKIEAESTRIMKDFQCQALNDETGYIETFKNPANYKPVLASAAARPIFDVVEIGGQIYSDAGPVSVIPNYKPEEWDKVVVVIPRPQDSFKRKHGIIRNIIHNFEIHYRREYKKEVINRTKKKNIYFIRPFTDNSSSWFGLDWKVYEEVLHMMGREIEHISNWWRDETD